MAWQSVVLDNAQIQRSRLEPLRLSVCVSVDSMYTKYCTATHWDFYTFFSVSYKSYLLSFWLESFVCLRFYLVSRATLFYFFFCKHLKIKWYTKWFRGKSVLVVSIAYKLGSIRFFVLYITVKQWCIGARKIWNDVPALLYRSSTRSSKNWLYLTFFFLQKQSDY